jgi:hypothetical protein
MCHFLTVSVPGSIVPAVPEKFRKQFSFDLHTNPSVVSLISPGWISFTATSGGCSCGFYQSHDRSKDRVEKLRKKFSNKGWSESKIARALEPNKAESVPNLGLRPDVVDLLNDLVCSFGEVRVSLHFYSGAIETEVFHLEDVGRVLFEVFKENSTLLRKESSIHLIDS